MIMFESVTQQVFNAISEWIEAAKKPIAWLLGSGVLVFILRWALRAFMRATDVTLGWNWSFKGTMDSPYDMRPNLDIRNRSQSRTYRLLDIKYTAAGHTHHFDRTSINGVELKPCSMESLTASVAVPRISSLNDCMELRVTIRTQTGMEIQGQGTNQPLSKMRRIALRIRGWMDKASIPVE
jgi:hypothetical protein